MARRKAYDPAKATQAAFERKARDAEVERLRASGAEVVADPAGRIISARRSNVFTLFLARKTITASHHDAAYRLAQDWAIWKGLDGAGERSEAVDGGAGSAELVTDRMIQAGRRVAVILFSLNRQDARLLCAFMCATVEEDRAMAWRGIVERETGLQRGEDTVNGVKKERQAQAVVDALEALRECYEGTRRQAA